MVYHFNSFKYYQFFLNQSLASGNTEMYKWHLKMKTNSQWKKNIVKLIQKRNWFSIVNALPPWHISNLYSFNVPNGHRLIWFYHHNLYVLLINFFMSIFWVHKMLLGNLCGTIWSIPCWWVSRQLVTPAHPMFLTCFSCILQLTW